MPHSRDEVRAVSNKGKPSRPKVYVIPGKGAAHTINHLLHDRDELTWLVAVGRNHDGALLFYDSGGDVIEDLGAIEYLKQRIVLAHLEEEPE